MKAPTDRRRQWAWFAALWASGALAAFALAYLARWLITTL
jgi:hypothetical protein